MWQRWALCVIIAMIVLQNVTAFDYYLPDYKKYHREVAEFAIKLTIKLKAEPIPTTDPYYEPGWDEGCETTVP
ncbi:hypothetical protein KM043_011716 [Ampulex compressa]|uniref:Venom protein n=1 Tax=Ampulex compressa TaxID=860918 RepID=A0A1W6EVS7_AMPCP|nr:venom protein [Ampulex compressa]KAG7210155.1 hypothetical protein KM043_011716 [Ampulex compressa]